MITTIIFDYGRVLAYPVTGNWFITPSTKRILGYFNYLYLLLNYKKMGKSFRKAQNYLDENHILHTEQEEYIQFIEFYTIFLKSIGFKRDMSSICESLSKDIVYNDKKVQFYSDVIEKMNELKTKYKIIILSDTWPSLKRVLENKGVLAILDGLIMSCDFGETKESIRLFEIAIEKLKLNPKECLFIDDSVSNLENSQKVGFIPVLMDRNNKVHESKYPVMKDMNDIIRFASQYE